jgi:hypothetical protein
MNRYKQDRELADKLGIPMEDATTLRRASLTLHRWAEEQCGMSNDYSDWTIEQDEETGHWFRVIRERTGRTYRYRISDREKGALARCRSTCERTGLHFFHQTDPRGRALYVSREPLTNSDYTKGIPV